MSAATEWSTFHGDVGRTGNIAGSNITAANVHTLENVTTMQIGGAILSVPAINGGYVYVGTANGTGTPDSPNPNGGGFHKIALASGKIEQSYYWQTPGPEGDTHGFTGMGCTPAIVDGKVYFSAFNGKLYCLDADTLAEIWVTDLRYADLPHRQHVNNPNVGVQAEGWCSPLVVNGKVYVGIGEGENPDLFGFLYCLDANTGDVVWLYCTSMFEKGKDNAPNVIPKEVVASSGQYPLPKEFSTYDGEPFVKCCVVWTALAYDADLNQVFCNTGNPPQPVDNGLPADGYAYSIMALDADTGVLRNWRQIPPESSYRKSDTDVDFGASPVIYDQPQAKGGSRKLLCAACKNGGFFVLDATTFELLKWRQILPYYNEPNADGTPRQISTVDPHGDDDPSNPNPVVSNKESNETPAENFHGTYSTPAIDPASGKIFVGSGGNNYHFIAAGIDYQTTPFMRAFDWVTLKDAWPMDDSDPRKYVKPVPPMYTNPGEAGLSSPAVVNDVVFCSTSKIALYAFSTADGATLWGQDMGMQTGGFNGGYGYCLGPAISGDYVVAGGLVRGRDGGVLMIYRLPGGDANTGARTGASIGESK